MIALRKPILALALILPVAGIHVTAPALAQQPRYQPWEPDKKIHNILDELTNLIIEAERARAADPQFIKDLKSLVRHYRGVEMGQIFIDTFKDGDYTRNPSWKVQSGQWRVDTGGERRGLRSSVAIPGQVTQQDLAGQLLTALLSPQGGSNAAPQVAQIATPVKISNQFQLRFEFAGREPQGRLDIGVYQGQGGNTYRVVYLPGAPNNLQVIRASGGQIVRVARSRNSLNLNDGRNHTIELSRDESGNMILSADGQQVAQGKDTAIQNGLDGVVVANGGGTYWIRMIEVIAEKSE